MKLLPLYVIVFLILMGCSENNGTSPGNFGTIIGKITDSGTGKPVVDVIIQTEPSTISTIADSLGKYIIPEVEAGRYKIMTHKICYKDSSITVSVNQNDTTTSDVVIRKLDFSDSWDMSQEYSITSNPNGVWSYGRKWSPDGNAFDILNVRWGDSGWYLGNWGHGGPSIQQGPNLWAKDNSNGIPAVRWTCPASGYYNLEGKFTGVDSRGVDVKTFVTVNDSIIFTDNIEVYLGTTHYRLDCISLNQNDYIDFSIKWNGGVYYETSWTIVNGIISKYIDM